MVQQYLPGLILNTILETVREMNDPYQAKPGLGGMTAYPPKAMAVVCILMEAEMKTYRKMVGYLRMHPDVVRRIGLSGASSKNTIWRAYGRIPESYLRGVRLRIVRDVTTGPLAGASTICYPGNRFTRRFSIRHDRTETKRGRIKLHGIMDITTRAIPDCHVTDGYAADITCMRPMMDRPGASGEDGNFFPDSAYPYGYLARLLCEAIANRGRMLRILPKPNTVCKNGGSRARGEMTRTRGNDPERFMSGLPPAQHHHQGRLWGNQEDVRQPPPGQEARLAEPGGGHPGNLLQHRGGRAVSRKKRQAHARVTRDLGCLTDAVTPAPPMWGSLRIILWIGLGFTVSDNP